MSSARTLKSTHATLPPFDEFYADLVSRNHHFVSREAQQRLKTFKILIAGCGSTGGACIEALARAGVCRFWLADNGDYELSNLNRQHARIENIGQNKAEFHAAEVKSINPYSQIFVATDGITQKNVDEFVGPVDMVFDAVDVTTEAGIRAKVLLHQKCHAYKKPVLSGLDLGYLQWGCSFDYRQGSIDVLRGTAEAALAAKHPLVALFRIYPLQVLPGHAAPLIEDLMQNRCDFASQMGCTSDALSAVIVPAVLKFVEHGALIPRWSVDLSSYRFSLQERLEWWWKGLLIKRKLSVLIRSNHLP